MTKDPSRNSYANMSRAFVLREFRKVYGDFFTEALFQRFIKWHDGQMISYVEYGDGSGKWRNSNCIEKKKRGRPKKIK